MYANQEDTVVNPVHAMLTENIKTTKGAINNQWIIIYYII